jgi:hypothetical protein
VTHTIPPLNWRATINCPLQDIKPINKRLPKKIALSLLGTLASLPAKQKYSLHFAGKDASVPSKDAYDLPK